MNKKSLPTLIVFATLLSIPTTQLMAKCEKEDKYMCVCEKGQEKGKLVCKRNRECKCAVVGVYAAGDQFEFDVTDAQKQDLGQLTETKKIKVDFPKMGSKKLFTLTPTIGESANQPMSLLLTSSPANEEALESNPFAKSVVKIYRRYKGEQLWTELDTINSSKEKIDTIPIRIKQDATAIIETPLGEDLVIDFGKVFLG